MAKRGGRRRDPARERFWRRTIRDQQRSGLSVRDFCKREGLNDGAFRWWRRELPRRDQETSTAPRGEPTEAAPVFLPVDGAPRWPEAAAYPGVFAGLLFLAGLAFSLRRREEFPRGLFLALAAGGLVGLVFAAGERGPYGLLAELPLLRGFRVPARYLTSWSLALALGSALADLAELVPHDDEGGAR